MNEKNKIISDELANLARTHKAFHLQKEAEAWRRARMLYKGQQPDNSEKAVHTVTWNYIFQICESAVSSLLGDAIEVYADPNDTPSIELAEDSSSAVNHAFTESAIVDEIRQSIVDMILLGRAIYKVRWCDDQVRIECVRPDNIYFDQAARRPSQITYWLQAVPMHISELKRKIKQKIYRQPEDMDQIHPEHIPAWLGRIDNTDPSPADYVVVWEYYDVPENKVIHWLDCNNLVLLEDELPPQGVPFVLLEGNPDGDTCLGLSEVSLIQKLQECLNDVMQKIWEIAKVSEPVTVFDSGNVDADSIAKMFDAAGNPARFVGIKTMGNNPNPVAAYFYDLPQPAIPQVHTSLLELLPTIISQVSALSDLSRGQTVGAKTATEMAMLDAQIRTRLKMKEHLISRAISSVADKTWALLSRYGKTVLVRRGEELVSVDPKRAESADLTWHHTAYNSLRSNPLIEAEQLASFIPIAEKYNQVVKPELLVKRLYRLRGLPEALLQESEEEDVDVKPEDMAQLAQLAATAAAGVSPPAM